MGHCRTVVVIIVGMALVLALAGWVLYQAAYEPLRRGTHGLTPEGERLTREARDRALGAAATARRTAEDVRSTVNSARERRRAAPSHATESDSVDIGQHESSDADLSPASDVSQTTDAPVDSGATQQVSVDAQADHQPVGRDTKRDAEQTVDITTTSSSEVADAKAPPRQQGSPVATPANGVSGTISR